MKRLKILTSAFFVAIALMLTASKAMASEGTAELASTTGQDTRCFVSSVLMPSLDYQILVSCRGLIYPPAADQFSYLLWATPISGKNPAKLGQLGVGKAQFKTNTAFASLFVTKEANDRVRAPSSDIVMQGNLQSIQYLETGTPQTPTGQEVKPAEKFGEILTQPSPKPTPTVTQQKGILSGISRIGVIFAVVLFVIILIIAAITRARG